MAKFNMLVSNKAKAIIMSGIRLFFSLSIYLDMGGFYESYLF